MANPTKHWTLNINWGKPFHNGLNLTKVHANVISKNNITQEFHFKLMESTPFQNKTYMALLVYHVLRKNEDIIDVIDHKIIQILTKDIIHHMLKNTKCIGNAKSHHNIFKMVVMNSKHRLPFITFSNVHQVVWST